MKEFSPRLEILPAAQRSLWSEFSGVPEEFVLYGGTAVALHLGHRHSIDFDFFGNRGLDPFVLEPAIFEITPSTLEISITLYLLLVSIGE